MIREIDGKKYIPVEEIRWDENQKIYCAKCTEEITGLLDEALETNKNFEDIGDSIEIKCPGCGDVNDITITAFRMYDFM